jgi:heme exporter protein B
MSTRSYLTMFRWMVQRDLILAWRQRTDVLSTLFFFMVVSILLPLGVDPEPGLLRSIGPGAVWIAVLLSLVLSLNRLFAGDYCDGFLDQILLSPLPLYFSVIAKVTAHIAVTGFPFLLASPLLAIQFGFGLKETLVLVVSLALGIPTLILIGSVSAALMPGVRGGTALIALLVLPLCIPALIFGTGMVAAPPQDGNTLAGAFLLAAVLVLTVVFAPWATSHALRISVE